MTAHVSGMGDRACWLEMCPKCDVQVTVVDEECPGCGATLGN